MSSKLVLVTGGSGFIGVHCILQLFQSGYRVRTTVRSLEREADVRAMLRVGGVDPADALSFAIANLSTDEGWPQAVAGCDFVLHVASPFPLKVPRDENELIIPAREGALRVLRAARDCGVRRVVLTSSFAAIGYGTTPGPEPYTEENWTNPDGPGVTPYVKSKTLAERAAWDFMAREGGSLQLSVVNPVGVFGPVFSNDYSTSIVIVRRLLDGGVPACPRLKFGAVDVRDVASLHLSAMTHPAAAGERFLAVAGPFISILQIAQILRGRMGAAAKRVPTREMPDWILRFIGMFDSTIRQIVPELGKSKDATSAKAQRMLGWEPLSAEDSIVATAESLLQLGLVKR
jgi:nucleoside-diphosphate-sugar epimerase